MIPHSHSGIHSMTDLTWARQTPLVAILWAYMLPRGSTRLPFGYDSIRFLFRDSNIPPKRELHWSLWVDRGLVPGFS